MPDQPRRRRSSAPGAGVVAVASMALAAFLALVIVLAIQLRDHPGAAGLTAQKPRIVIVRRIYQTTVHERIIAATGATPAGGTTVSSSSANVSGPPLPAAPVTTRTSHTP